MKIHIRVQDTNSYKYSILNLSFGHVTVILHNWVKNRPNMGVAAPVGGWSVGPPQKFGHWFEFVGQLLSRKQVPQFTEAGPPP